MRRLAPAVLLLSAGLALSAVARADTDPYASSSGLLIALAAPARTVAQGSIPMRLRGELTIEFHGDRTTGCAAKGLCDLTGVIVWRPPRVGSIDYATLVQRGAVATTGFLTFFEEEEPTTTVTAVVRRARADGSIGTCGDTERQFTALGFDGAGTGMTVGLDSIPAGRLGANLVATRCGGPLQSDIRAALPTVHLSPRQLRRGDAPVDLRTVAHFARHGLAGTLRSSIVLHLGRAKLQRGESSGSSRSPIRIRYRRVRMLDSFYKITRVSGRVPVAIEGARDPFVCETLDACGSTGILTVLPAARTGMVDLTAMARAARPRRDLRAALGLQPGGRRRGIRFFGFGSWERSSGSAAAVVRRPGALAPCSDVVPVGPGALGFDESHGEVTVTYGEAEQTSVDPLRTRCPGPGIADAGPRPLASGTVPLRDFGRRVITIHLTRGTSFSGQGYAGRSAPDLTVVLRRTRLTDRVSRQPTL